MTTRRVGRDPRNVPVFLIAAFAAVLAAACVSPALAQGAEPAGPAVTVTPEADIIFGWVARQYAVLGPKRVQSVSPAMLVLQAGASPIGVNLTGKRVRVMDRLGNGVGLDLLQPGVTVHLGAKGDELNIMIVPTQERTEGPTEEVR